MRDTWALIAQTTTGPAGTATPGGAPPPRNGMDMFFIQIFPLILLGFLFYFVILRPQKRERQKMQEMLGSLKRNDRVQTIGGLYGTVVDVRDHEVVLKIDETNNVKVRFNRAAIKEVIREPAPAVPAPPSEPVKK